jgi:branched-chain amino acid transport system permease protein
MLLQQVVSGLAVGCVYALVALGFILIYKTTEVLNFAQGEIMMVGAFMAFTFISTFKIPLLLAIPFTLAFMALFGIVIERIFLRPLIGEPVFALVMVTVGLSVIIRTVAGMVWTHESVGFPQYFSEEPVRFAGTVISPVHIGIIVTTLGLVIILGLFFKFTNVGIAMRACGLNQLATLYMGISIKRTFTITWALSAVVATIAGILLAPIIFLNTDMGFVGLKAFPAAILGGFGSIPGAVVGGIIIGVCESVAGIYLPSGFKDVFAHVVLIAVLLIKPTGIFGIPEHKRV